MQGLPASVGRGSKFKSWGSAGFWLQLARCHFGTFIGATASWPISATREGNLFPPFQAPRPPPPRPPHQKKRETHTHTHTSGQRIAQQIPGFFVVSVRWFNSYFPLISLQLTCPKLEKGSPCRASTKGRCHLGELKAEASAMAPRLDTSLHLGGEDDACLDLDRSNAGPARGITAPKTAPSPWTCLQTGDTSRGSWPSKNPHGYDGLGNLETSNPTTNDKNGQ